MPSTRKFLDGAHPRSRGEHLMELRIVRLVSGSSPLTRGAPSSPQIAFQSHGLIPAHAGSTAYVTHTVAEGRAHPRSRGEHLVTTIRVRQPAGSSPLTRGAHRGSAIGIGELGLIPAHAGSTLAEQQKFEP